MSDKFWSHDPSILLNYNRLTEFFPVKEHSTEEQLNSIARLTLYIGVILSLYYSDYKYLNIVICGLIFTYIIYVYRPSNVEKIENTEEVVVQEDNGEKLCTMPTVDNPFMNATMKDYLNLDENGTIKERLPACDLNDPDIKKKADESFNNNLYKDISDIFGKMNSQRQFYTAAGSDTIPNDRESFTKWLYASPMTCKENQEYCIRGIEEDVRRKRFIFPNPEENPVNSKRLTDVS